MLPLSNISFLAKQTKLQEKLAIFLAFIAGYIDAVGLVKWKIYVSFMSGNTTQLGTALSAGKTVIVVTSLTVILCFLLGIYTGTCLALRKKNGIHTLPFYMFGAILMLYTMITAQYPISTTFSIAIISFLMGIMNTIATAVGNQKMNTNFVTGTLNSLARNMAMWSMTADKTMGKQYQTQAFHLLLVWTGFLLGAYAATCLSAYLGNWTLALPALFLLFAPVKPLNLKP